MRKLRVTMGLCALMGLVAAASPAALAKVRLVHYNYTGHGDDHANFVRARAQEFMKRNPNIEIDIVTNAGGDYWEKLATMQAGGVVPDILELYPASAAPFLQAGMVMDLRPFLEKDPDVKISDWVPVTIEGHTWQGMIWGLPTSTFQILTFYNRDLFDRNGITTPDAQGSAWNWDSVIKSGLKLTQDLNGDGRPDQWGVRASHDLFRWWIWVHQAGGMLFDRVVDPSEARFNTPQARTGLQFLADMYVTHKIVNPDHNVFYQGKTAVDLVSGPSFFGILPKMVGNDWQWDIAQLPAGPVNNGSMVFLNSFQMGAHTKNPKESWEWLKFLVGRESMREYVRMTGRTPALRSLLPEYARLLPQPPRNLAAAGDAIMNPAAKTEYLTVAATDIRSFSNSVTNRVIQGQLTVPEALEQIHRYANQRLQEVKGK